MFNWIVKSNLFFVPVTLSYINANREQITGNEKKEGHQQIKAHNGMLGEGEKRHAFLMKSTQRKHTTPGKQKRVKMRLLSTFCTDTVAFGWRGASIGRKKVSFCYYIHILLSITVCQTATNEVISIF